MDRGTRRDRTNKIANKRLRMLKQKGELYDVDSPGFFKKDNGFTIKKESRRLWNKIRKKKAAKFRFKRRNSII
jgi:hypothetical protein